MNFIKKNKMFKIGDSVRVSINGCTGKIVKIHHDTCGKLVAIVQFNNNETGCYTLDALERRE